MVGGLYYQICPGLSVRPSARANHYRLSSTSGPKMTKLGRNFVCYLFYQIIRTCVCSRDIQVCHLNEWNSYPKTNIFDQVIKTESRTANTAGDDSDNNLVTPYCPATLISHLPRSIRSLVTLVTFVFVHINSMPNKMPFEGKSESRKSIKILRPDYGNWEPYS